MTETDYSRQRDPVATETFGPLKTMESFHYSNAVASLSNHVASIAVLFAIFHTIRRGIH